MAPNARDQRDGKAQEAGRITVARVLRPHGRRGEVAAEFLTDFPARLKELKAAILWDGSTEPRQTAIRSCWISQSRGGQAIFHFAGSDSISDAKKLVGLEVQIPLAERMPLPDGCYYISDLVGCEVVERGKALGRVRDVEFTGESLRGTPLLIIGTGREEIQIPLAQEICVRVDIAGKKIEVALPEGLLELNRDS
jgi:16S rRNA processing protein RimM